MAAVEPTTVCRRTDRGGAAPRGVGQGPGAEAGLRGGGGDQSLRSGVGEGFWGS